MLITEEKGDVFVGVIYSLESGASRADDIVFGYKKMGDGSILMGEFHGVIDVSINEECTEPLCLSFVNRKELMS